MNAPSGVEDSDPYLRVLQVRKLITTIYETVAVSNSMQGFQLMSTGKTLLQLIAQMRDTKSKVVKNDNKTTDIISIEVEKLWTIFSTIFHRVLSSEDCKTETQTQNEKQEFRDFLDFIWEKHKIDSSNAAAEIKVISKVLLLSPSRLEDLLRSSLSSSNPEMIVPYCEKNSEMFMAIMTSLSRKYRNPSTTVQSSSDDEVMLVLENNDIINYSQRLIFNLQTLHSPCDYYNLYPSIFHPVLAFDKSISNCKNPASLLENVQVLEELFVLLDNLVNHCINTLGLEYAFLNFFVLNQKNICSVLKKAKSSDTIRYNMFPFLWMFVKKQ